MTEKIARREFMIGAGAALALSAQNPSASEPKGAALSAGAPRKRPNIVYLFSDEHRYQSMSFTETPQVQTPNMARMAKEGVSFEYAISNNPVCVPYRCMLLSGQWPHRTGAVDNQGGLAPWDRTVAHAFGDAGYATGYTGKWHAGPFPERAGFDWHMNWGGTNDHWNSFWTPLHGDGVRRECKTYQPVKMTDQALEFLDANASGDKPFLLMVSWNPPHAFFTDAPKEKKALYPDSAALPWRENAHAPAKIGWWANYQGYHAHVTAIDEQIRRVYDKLRDLGIADNTIVVYTADHGSMMNSHGKGNKRHPDDESCRVPFLVTGPGVPAGKTRRELFGTIDIVPTLCGLAGIDAPDACDGQDFAANILGRPGACAPKTQLLMHVARQRRPKRRGGVAVPPELPATAELVKRSTDALFFRGVRSERYTYSVNFDGEWKLWDNEKDPLQMTNLIDDPAYADVRKQMRAELDAWLAKAEDPFVHEDYLKMSLPDRILQQAIDGASRLPLHHICMRLKLRPDQFKELPEIRVKFYDDRGQPLNQTGDDPWQQAAQDTVAAIRPMLDAKQRVLFDEMLALEAHS